MRIMVSGTITYTGGEMYWIAYYRGTHEVRRETPSCYDNNETVFTGSYEKCVQYLEDLKIANAEYDLDI